MTALGQLQKTYARGIRGSWLLVLLGLALAGTGLVLAIVSATAAPSTADEQNQVLVRLITAGGLFAFGLVAIISTWFAWTTTAALYEQGVAVRTTKGLRQVAWTDIATVYVRVVRQPGPLGFYITTHLYTVETTAGAKLLFDDSVGDEVAKLGNLIQLNVAKTQFGRYWDAYQSGRRVTFGPLALDKQKLYVGEQELPWSSIRSVKIEQGSVWIEKTDKGWIRWTAVSVPDVPNLLVFQNLIGRLTRTV